MRNATKFFTGFTNGLTRIFGSNKFFIATLVLIILQALWYIFTFIPSINDEIRHFDIIAIYGQQISPFLPAQDLSWDYLGAVSRNGAFMFYYIMSWPYRIIHFFTSDYMNLVIALRLLCLGVFVWGVVLYRKVLQQFKELPNSVINLVFLLFALIPSVALLPATINYDNFIFTMYAGLLLLSIRQLQSKSIEPVTLSLIVVLMLFMETVKWTSFALIIPVFIVLAYDLFTRRHTLHVKQVLKKFKVMPRYQLVGLVGIFAIASFLFLYGPGYNALQYGKAEPPCRLLIGPERCEASWEYNSRQELLSQKPDYFQPENPVRFTIAYWEPRIADTLSNVLEAGNASDLPVIKAVIDALIVVGLVFGLIWFRHFWDNKLYRFLIIAAVGYVLVLLIGAYRSYITYGGITAVRARYLIPVLPIFMYISAAGIYKSLHRYKKLLVSGVILLLLLLIQGGGIMTYLITTPEQLYWNNGWFTSVTSGVKYFLRPYILGG